MDRRRSERTTPQKLAEVAREYYFRDRTQSEIAASERVNQTTIAHWIAEAHKQGIVAIDIDPDFALTGYEHADLSRRLRNAFNLYDCLVVDPADPALYDDGKSDKLHTVIANVSGSKLREWIRSGDHIAIGGGRAPMRVARFIRRNPSSRSEIRISPLSGRIWIGSWQEAGADNLQRPLDADDAARMLALAYEHERGTRFSQIGRPLYAESREIAQRIIVQECAFQPGGRWRDEIQPPRCALVGIGALHPGSGHRISELLDSPETRTVTHLDWAAGKYRKAIAFTIERKLKHFGDVANRLFPVVPLPSELRKTPRPSRADYDKLRQQLDELNHQAIVMEWEHLRKTPSVWAIAGGRLKLHALWTLLICRRFERDRSRSLIKELSVDLRTAQSLENALNDFDNASNTIQNWYAEICPRIFGS